MAMQRPCNRISAFRRPHVPINALEWFQVTTGVMSSYRPLNGLSGPRGHYRISWPCRFGGVTISETTYRTGSANRPGTNRKRKPKRTPGEQYTIGSYRRAIHRACGKAGIDRWSPNRLRHSAGTEIRKRYGLEAAQVILGHASADVTQIYAERDLAKAVEIMREVG